MKFAKMLTGHRTGILAYYDYPITYGLLEGTTKGVRISVLLFYETHVAVKTLIVTSCKSLLGWSD